MMVMAMMMGLGVIMMIIIDDAYESCCEDNDEDKFCHKYFTNEIISFWFAGRQCRSVTYVGHLAKCACRLVSSSLNNALSLF